MSGICSELVLRFGAPDLVVQVESPHQRRGRSFVHLALHPNGRDIFVTEPNRVTFRADGAAVPPPGARRQLALALDAKSVWQDSRKGLAVAYAVVVREALHAKPGEEEVAGAVF